MAYRKDLHEKIAERFGPVIDQRKNPDVFERLIDDVAALLQSPEQSRDPTGPPFGVSWMDSWVAHWVYAQNLQAAESRNQELATVLRGLADLKFNERLTEIRALLRDRLRAEPPDGGPPEPGTPPAGPASIFAEPPDGGTPEPGVPDPPAGPATIFADEPPDGGPPEPGVPDPPSPPGPEHGAFRDNPWILYWFISIRTPLLLDVIDAHLTRRLNDLRAQIR